MFGSTNPFGQSSSSPFGSQSLFGQTSSSSTNPFAPKPFGSPNPFGSQSGGSIFGGTSTGVFGQPSSSLPSTPTFGASSAPAFGGSVPAFGASSAPAFGGSPLFGQKPAFGGFGSSPSQSSPFGSTFQQSQPAFGSNLFGSSTPFGASSQPAFGATSTPAFGSTSTPAFGATTTPSFGATTTPAFGSATTPAFGSTSTSIFGSTGTAFGASTTPAFGSTVTAAFGAPSTSLFGSSSTPAFGASSTPTFGSSSVPAFGASSTPSFSFGSTPSFGQSTSTFGSTPFGTAPSPFGAQSSPFGAQATTPTFGSPGFGQSAFGGQLGGSRITAYTPTPEVDGGSGTQPAGKLESISAMPMYKDKSHEELRWEDYQRGDKGGPNPSGQPAGGIGFSAPTQSSPFGSTGTFGQPTANPFSSSTSSNPFALKTPTFGSSGFGASSSSIFSSPFSSSSSSPFGSTSSTTSLFGAPTGAGFGPSSSPSIFGGTTAPAFGSSPSIFGSSMAGSSSSFGTGLSFGSTQSSGLFQSSTPSFAQTPSPFGQPSSGFQQTTPSFGSNLFSAPSTGFGGSLFSNSTPSLFPSSTPAGFGQSTPSLSTPFQPAAPAQTSNTFSFSGFNQTQPVEEDLQTEEAQPHETYHPTKSETLGAVSGKEALMFDKGLLNPAQPAGLATPPLSSSEEPIRKEILNPSSVDQLKEAVQSAEAWTMATGSTLGQIQKEEGQNLAQPHEAFQPMELAASAAGTPTLDEGLNPAQPQEAVPAPKPGTPVLDLDLDEGLSPATLTLPRFSRIAEASSFQTLTKQVVAWAHLKGDIDAIKTMLQEEPVPTDYVEELLRNMISEESVSGYCFKDFRDSVSQILNEIKRQQSVNLDSVVEELTTAKSKQVSNLRQSVNRYKFLMRGYDKEVESEISLKAELVKNRGEIRTQMNTLEQELEQARDAFAKNEAQIHKQDEAISKARACVDSASQEIQKAEEECSQVEESLDKVGEEAEAKMRKQLEGLQASKAVFLEFDMPQCLPRTN